MIQFIPGYPDKENTPRKRLSPVPENVAAKIHSKVSFQDRFVGGRLRQRAGIVRVTSYSFEEVVNLLNDRRPMIHFKALERWIREVMEDKDLAEKIAEAIHKEKDYLDTLLHIKSLMEERLEQCQKRANTKEQQSSKLPLGLGKLV